MTAAPRTSGGGAPLMIPNWVVAKLAALDADPYLVIHKLWEHVQSAGLYPPRIHLDDVPGATGRLLSKARLDKALAALHRHEFDHDGKVVKLWIDFELDYVVLPEWWVAENPPPSTWHDDTERMRYLRAKRLRSARFGELRRQIRDRDRNLCRYCGIRVKWDAHNAPHGGTFDHVDPDVEENTLENIVVACRRCNGRKNYRTPEQANMPVLPPGTLAADAAAVQERIRAEWLNKSSAPAEPEPSQVSRTRARPPRAEPEPSPSRPDTPRHAPTRPVAPRPDTPRQEARP